MKNSKPTELSELGEFGLIKHLTQDITCQNQGTIKGVGDDAAVLYYPSKKIVLTTDLLLEGIHFNLMYTPLKHLGYKAVIVNISDVYAMNAIPRQITVSVGISNKFSLEAVNELYDGIKQACDNYKVDLVGGDTSASLTGMIISITAVGEDQNDNIIYRNQAKLNDLICVTGDLGAAYLGLQLLEREKEIFKSNPNLQPDFTGYDYLLKRQLRPEARRDIIELMKSIDLKVNSMIDISDGLSSEILHICTSSDVGCRIFEEKVPIHDDTIQMATEFNIEPVICAMNGGEDYELLFTIPPQEFSKIKEEMDISVIGFITDKAEGVNLITKDNAAIAITAQGWNAYKNEKG